MGFLSKNNKYRDELLRKLKPMKAFEFNFDPSWYEDETYPEDCKKIYDFLKSKGKLNISPKRIPDYYYDFSDEMYDAGWMDVDCYVGANDEIFILDEFADWLSEQEI